MNETIRFYFVFENGDVKCVKDVTEDDLSCADDGFCTLLDVVNHLTRVDGEWIPIQKGGGA